VKKLKIEKKKNVKKLIKNKKEKIVGRGSCNERATVQHKLKSQTEQQKLDK